jgi:hypothetical protein
MTDPGPITRFCNMLTQVNITEIDEDDPHYVLYAVRVPAEARLDHDALVALGNDDEFGAALAAWLKMRARGISE